MVRWKLYAVMLVAPMLALLVFSWILNSMEGDLRRALEKEGAPPEARQAFTLRQACLQTELSKEPICREHGRLTWLYRFSLGAIGAGVALPLAIRWAGLRSRRHRQMLVRVFGLGLKATVGVVALLMLVHGVLIIAALYYAQVMLMERFFPKLLMLVGIGAAVGVWTLLRSAFAMVKEADAHVFGHLLPEHENPQLWGEVRALAAAAGTAAPQNIVAGLDGTFFVTEAKVNCLDGPLHGRTLFVSLPLSRILSTGELRGIVAHELAHFLGEDTQFSLKFYPIYRGAGNAVLSLAEAVGQSSWVGGTALWPGLWAMVYFLESFAEAESEVSRERELAADALAARLAGAREIAVGLVKCVAFAESCGMAAETIFDRGKQSQEPVAAGAVFTGLVATVARPEQMEGLDEVKVAHPTDSHPPLSVRLGALGTSLDECRAAALDVRPAVPAFTLFDTGEAVEEALSARIRETGQEQAREVEPPAFATLPD